MVSVFHIRKCFHITALTRTVKWAAPGCVFLMRWKKQQTIKIQEDKMSQFIFYLVGNIFYLNIWSGLPFTLGWVKNQGLRETAINYLIWLLSSNVQLALVKVSIVCAFVTLSYKMVVAALFWSFSWEEQPSVSLTKSRSSLYHCPRQHMRNHLSHKQDDCCSLHVLFDKRIFLKMAIFLLCLIIIKL